MLCSDPLGRISCVHGRFTSVIDLAIVPHAAQPNVAVLPVRTNGCDHRALVVTVLAVPSCPAIGSLVLLSTEASKVQPVQMKLTSEEATVFCGFDWPQVAEAVLTAGDAT